MEMFYLQFRCIPSETSDNYREMGGAYVSCWIKAVSIKDAKRIAELVIQENNWLVQGLEESHPIKQEDY